MIKIEDSSVRKWIFGLLLCCVFICVAVYFYLGGYLGFDIEGHWRICTYALKGYNPYLYIGQEGPIPEIGNIPPGFSTVPWACVFGSVFYGGFMSLEAARIYNVLLHIVSIVLLVVVFYKTTKHSLSKFEQATIALAFISQFSIMYSIYYGNAGGIICCLLMVSILLGEKHPYISGVLVALAMMKPQIAAIVCVVFLLQKRWKVLFTGASIDILGWLVTSVITKVSPLELLTSTFSSGTASEFQYLGVLSVLQYCGLDKSLVLVLNVAVGFIYTIGLWYYLKKNKTANEDELILYMPACIASTVWIYKNGTDYAILAFVTMFVCTLCFKRALNFREKIYAILSIAFLQVSRVAVYIGVTIWGESSMARDILKGSEGFILLIIGIVLCKMWVRAAKKQI